MNVQEAISPMPVKHYCRKCKRELLKFDYVTGFCVRCDEPIPPKDNPYDEYYEEENNE